MTENGTITCLDKSNSYYVLIKQTDTANQKTSENIALVVNGEGKFSTYDTTFDENIKKPEYEFEIIGYIPFNK